MPPILLLEHNSGFIRKTANEIFLKSNLAESDLSIEPGDLEQEACNRLIEGDFHLRYRTSV